MAEFLSKKELRMSVDKFMRNKDVRNGMACLEKHIGYSIDWFHPRNKEPLKLECRKRYVVIDDETKNVFLEADRLTDIAKEFCTFQSKISKCMNSGKLLNGRYLIVRCEHE